MAQARREGSGGPAEEIVRDCLGARVRLLNRAISRVYDKALRPYDVTIAQLNLLSAVAELEPVPARKLADLLSLEISTLSRNMHLMEESGLIHIAQADRGNGRILSLTKAGARKLQELLPAWQLAQRETAELMGPDARRALKRLADGLLAEQLANI
jgi:DNA-binding MarR family transcriptional regulator